MYKPDASKFHVSKHSTAFCCNKILYFVYSFISLWTLRFFLLFGYCNGISEYLTPLCVDTYFFILDGYLGTEFLGWILSLCLIFTQTTKVSSKSSCTILHPHRPWMRVLPAPPRHQRTELCLFDDASPCGCMAFLTTALAGTLAFHTWPFYLVKLWKWNDDQPSPPWSYRPPCPWTTHVSSLWLSFPTPSTYRQKSPKESLHLSPLSFKTFHFGTVLDTQSGKFV